VADRAEQNAANVDLFAGAVDRLVGGDMREIALGGTRFVNRARPLAG
jgi:hypothetical protein